MFLIQCNCALKFLQQQQQSKIFQGNKYQDTEIVSIDHDSNYSFNILKKMRFNLQENKIMTLYSMIKDFICKINSKFLKIILIRKLLIQNVKSLHLKYFLHPRTGNFSICSIAIFPNYELNSNELFKKQIIDSFFTDSEQIFQEFEKHFKYFIEDKNEEDYQEKKRSNKFFMSQIKQSYLQIKKCIMESSYYAWSVLTISTDKEGSVFKQHYYQQSKKSFKQITKNCKLGRLKEQLFMPFIKSRQIMDPISLHTVDQDILINAKHLNLPNKHSNISFIKYLNVSSQFIEAVKNGKKQIKINSQQGLIAIRVHQFHNSQKKHLQYEKQLLNNMQPLQFHGLARYFFIKNYEQQTQLYRFTNLSASISLNKFLMDNSETLSLNSKINVLLQLILTLRYIRNNRIIYFNQLPKNIFVKKHQHIKLYNFTNSKDSRIKTDIKRKNIFPAVIRFDEKDMRTYNEEKSDSFNFGCLFYRMIFQKEPFNIKYSTLITIDTNHFISKIQSNILSPELYSIHKLDLIKLLIYFSLSCLNWNSKVSFQKVFFHRPYIDWISIIFKLLQTFLQTNFI